MRDIIWTIILIWLAWQFVNIFRRTGTSKGSPQFQQPPVTGKQKSSTERQKRLDSEGEYVDFEEIR